MMSRPVNKSSRLRLLLAQHDELGDHAGQAKPEHHENKFCQYGRVVVCHEILPASGVSRRGQAAGSPAGSEFSLSCPGQAGTGPACTKAPERGTVQRIEGERRKGGK